MEQEVLYESGGHVRFCESIVTKLPGDLARYTDKATSAQQTILWEQL